MSPLGKGVREWLAVMAAVGPPPNEGVILLFSTTVWWSDTLLREQLFPFPEGGMHEEESRVSAGADSEGGPGTIVQKSDKATRLSKTVWEEGDLEQLPPSGQVEAWGLGKLYLCLCDPID